MLKKLLLLLLTLSLTGCWAMTPKVENPAPEKDLQKIITAFEQANNPGQQTCRTYFMKMTASVDNTQIQMTNIVYGDPENKRIRTTVTVPGMPTQVELFDGRNGYNIIPGMQTKSLTGDKLAFLRFTAGNTKPWSCLKGSYDKIILDQNLYDINGKKCYRLVASPAGEPTLIPEEIFIDRATYLPVRSKSVIPTDLGKIPMVTDIQSYKKIHGAMVADRIRIRQLNMTIHVTLQEIKLNCPLPANIFRKESIENEEE